MRFSEYLSAVVRTANRDLTLPEQVVNASLSLFEEVGEIISHYKKNQFHGHPLSASKVIAEIGDALFYASWLFLCANEGNALDEGTLEMSFHWNLEPADAGFGVENLAQLAHIANRNLQNVIGSGVLERTAFYPSFRLLACLAAGVGRKLEDVAAENVNKLQIRYPNAFTTEDSIARVDVEG